MYDRKAAENKKKTRMKFTEWGLAIIFTLSNTVSRLNYYGAYFRLHSDFARQRSTTGDSCRKN